MTDTTAPRRDKPWMFRTYAGHSTARESNLLYRSNLAKGQTGLSIAFDLPTQTGYDSDHPLARGEVGKVGVPISHLGDMRTLFEGIPLGEMNTSMTINATAVWLMALYIAAAEEQGVPRAKLRVVPLGVDAAYRPHPREEIAATLAKHRLADSAYLLVVATQELDLLLVEGEDARDRSDTGLAEALHDLVGVIEGPGGEEDR